VRKCAAKTRKSTTAAMPLKKFDHKNYLKDVGETFAANVCELQRTLNTVSRAKASDPGLMAKSIGST